MLSRCAVPFRPLRSWLTITPVLLLSFGNGTAARAFDSGMVMRLCLAGFEAAMQSSGKTPPVGMGAFTCDCFVERVQSGASINEAQNVCRQQAAARYKMP
ncbi:MAG: hypothetical protein VKI83_11550 [Synechococcaceae cyanobacterium]|nr:hypothetical protein [Synechococcaceae cyanobacterium]